MPKYQVACVKSSLNHQSFAAGGFWVHDFVGIGPGKNLMRWRRVLMLLLG